jgi:hypothetical protein
MLLRLFPPSRFLLVERFISDHLSCKDPRSSAQGLGWSMWAQAECEIARQLDKGSGVSFLIPIVSWEKQRRLLSTLTGYGGDPPVKRARSLLTVNRRLHQLP